MGFFSSISQVIKPPPFISNIVPPKILPPKPKIKIAAPGFIADINRIIPPKISMPTFVAPPKINKPGRIERQPIERPPPPSAVHNGQNQEVAFDTEKHMIHSAIIAGGLGGLMILQGSNLGSVLFVSSIAGVGSFLAMKKMNMA